MWRVPVYILHWSLRPGQRQLLLWSHWGKDTGEVCAINKCYNKFTSNSRDNKCLLVFFLSFETQSTVGKTLAWKMLDKKSVTLKDHIKFCTYAVEETQCDINFWKSSNHWLKQLPPISEQQGRKDLLKTCSSIMGSIRPLFCNNAMKQISEL